MLGTKNILRFPLASAGVSLFPRLLVTEQYVSLSFHRISADVHNLCEAEIRPLLLNLNGKYSSGENMQRTI